jgi:hypothetical protein
MHCLNSGPGAAVKHALATPQWLGIDPLWQARTNVFQGGGEAFVFAFGRQPVCVGVGAAIVIDCTQGTPPQSFPAGIGFSPLQRPTHPCGGLDEVWGTLGPSSAQLAAAAVTVAGCSHDPLVGPHVQASHEIVPFR